MSISVRSSMERSEPAGEERLATVEARDNAAGAADGDRRGAALLSSLSSLGPL